LNNLNLKIEIMKTDEEEMFPVDPDPPKPPKP